MKIFSWMQSKFNAKQEAKNPNSSIAATNYRLQEAPREEFSDWPQALLAIGTFGNYNVEPVVSKKCGEEEETKIVRGDASTDIAVAAQNLGLEDDESTDQFDDTGNDAMVVNRGGGGKDGCLENKRKGGFGRKSMSLLVKKMFVCSSGIVLSPTSGLRDSTSPDKSRMEKMLRAILNKKIYPQNSSSSKKKNSRNGKKYFLETNHHIEEEEDNSDSEEEDDDGDSNDGSKWVKTDSEYIVLEI